MGLLNTLFGQSSQDDDCGVLYDDNVDYESLKQHTYDDSKGYKFYTCPKCGGEYLATFIVEKDGETMCIDCAS